jgi:hypothetical protein
MRFGRRCLGIIVPSGLISSWRNVAIGLGSVHYWVSHPFCSILALVAIPLAFGFQVRFVVWGETFHLLLRQIYVEVVTVFCGCVQLTCGHYKFLAAEPATCIDDYEPNFTRRMIENYVVDFS